MLCIYNARLVLADRIVDRGWVLVENDLINAVGQDVPPDEHGRVDAEGLYLATGFIDLHVHGGRGSDFLNAAPDAFLRAADFHLSGGTPMKVSYRLGVVVSVLMLVLATSAASAWSVTSLVSMTRD